MKARFPLDKAALQVTQSPRTVQATARLRLEERDQRDHSVLPVDMGSCKVVAGPRGVDNQERDKAEACMAWERERV